MNSESFIAQRIIKGTKNSKQLSGPIVRISVLGISLGLAVMILTISIVTGFQKEIRNKLIGMGSHIQISNYDTNISSEQIPIDKNQDFLIDLTNHSNIKSVQSFATKSGIVKTNSDNEGVNIKGIGQDFDWTFINQNMVEGERFTVNDSALSKNIVISKHLSNKLLLNVGDKMIIYFLTKKNVDDYTQYDKRVKVFYVSGIYETGFEDIDRQLVLVDIGQVQNLNGWDKNQVSGIEVKLNDYTKIDEVGDEFHYLVGHELNSQTVKELNPTVFSWLELQDVNAIIFIALMVLVAGINMISALLILILERTNMIGILKALGAQNMSIQKIFLINAAYLIGRGLIFGNLIGIGLALLQKHYGLVTLDQSSYYVSVVPINLNLIHILLLNIGTLLTCMLMLILPSFIVSKVSPVMAIRFS